MKRNLQAFEENNKETQLRHEKMQLSRGGEEIRRRKTRKVENGEINYDITYYPDEERLLLKYERINIIGGQYWGRGVFERDYTGFLAVWGAHFFKFIRAL